MIMSEQRTIPVRPELRDRIRRLKRGQTYDQFLKELADQYEYDG